MLPSWGFSGRTDFWSEAADTSRGLPGACEPGPRTSWPLLNCRCCFCTDPLSSRVFSGTDSGNPSSRAFSTPGCAAVGISPSCSLGQGSLPSSAGKDAVFLQLFCWEAKPHGALGGYQSGVCWSGPPENRTKRAYVHLCRKGCGEGLAHRVPEAGQSRLGRWPARWWLRRSPCRSDAVAVAQNAFLLGSGHKLSLIQAFTSSDEARTR